MYGLQYIRDYVEVEIWKISIAMRSLTEWIVLHLYAKMFKLDSAL